jgi:hypothetical protein
MYILYYIHIYIYICFILFLYLYIYIDNINMYKYNMVYTWYKKNMFICPKSACWLKLKPYDIFGRVRIQYPMDWENISWLHDPSVSFTRAYHVCNADEWCLWSIQHVIGEKNLFSRYSWEQWIWAPLPLTSFSKQKVETGWPSQSFGN